MAKRSCPEMAPQRLEKIESAPGNGMGSEASNPQDVVRGRAVDRARLRPTSRKNDKVESCRKRVRGAKVRAWAIFGVRWLSADVFVSAPISKRRSRGYHVVGDLVHQRRRRIGFGGLGRQLGADPLAIRAA